MFSLGFFFLVFFLSLAFARIRTFGFGVLFNLSILLVDDGVNLISQPIIEVSVGSVLGDVEIIDWEVLPLVVVLANIRDQLFTKLDVVDQIPNGLLLANKVLIDGELVQIFFRVGWPGIPPLLEILIVVALVVAHL